MFSEQPWYIDCVDDPRFTHSVGFSDEVAHERDDLITEAEDFLASLEGVDETMHEDREEILVRARLDDETFLARFDEWWETASRRPPPWVKRLEEIASEVHEVLEPHGFRKRKHLFNRESAPGVIQVVEIDRWSELEGDKVRLDVGIYLARVGELLGLDPVPTWVREALCQIRQPLETGDHRQGVPLPAAATELVAFAKSVAVPVLDRLTTVEAILAESDRGRQRLGWLGTEQRTLAALLVDDGDFSGANEVLQAAYESAFPQARGSLLALVDRLRAGPIVTGSEPLFSRDDEGFLRAWTESVEGRIDELRRLMAPARVSGFGLRRRRVLLDGSANTLPLVWRWIVENVAHLDELIRDPSPIPMRYRRSNHSRGMTPAQLHLSDLLAAYIGSAYLSSRWRLAMDCDLGVDVGTDRPFPLLSKVESAVAFAVDPSKTSKDPLRKRHNRLTFILDQVERARS